jgi:hypothetical protein
MSGALPGVRAARDVIGFQKTLENYVRCKLQTVEYPVFLAL